MAAATEFVLEGLHLHQKLNKDRDGRPLGDLPGLTASGRADAHARSSATPRGTARSEVRLDRRAGLREARPSTSPTPTTCSRRSTGCCARGSSWDGMRVMGLDEFLEQLREAMRAALPRRSTSTRALDEMRRAARGAARPRARHARRAARRRAASAQAQARPARSAAAPPLGGASSSCATTTSRTTQARAEFENLLEELENIRALEEFQRRYGELFHGPAVARLRRGARADARDGAPASSSRSSCSSGDLERIEPRGPARPARRSRRAQDFQHLQQMMLLARAGRLPHARARAASQLSPKGVRKIGQLALRDIYQGLLRDRPGGHQTDHRGVAEVRPDDDARLPLRRSARTSISCARSRRRWRAAPARRSRSQPDDFEVYETNHTTTTLDRAAARHELVDELGRPLRRRQEGGAGDGEPDPLALPARLLRHRRLLHARRRAQAARPARGELEHGRPVHQPAGRPAPGERAAGAPSEQQPAHHRHHRRPADGLLLARPPLLRVAAVLRRHQHARRAGDAEGSRARHPRASSSTPSCSTTARACAPSSSA